MKTRSGIVIIFLLGLILINSGWAAPRLPSGFYLSNSQDRTEMLAKLIDEQDDEISSMRIQIKSMWGEIDHLRFLIKHIESSISKSKK
jgi:hypothetical protein